MTTIESTQRFTPEFRRTHIGASEVAAACGLDPYRSPMDLWAEKVYGRSEDFDEGAREAMDTGHDMESGIVRNAARKLKMEVEDNTGPDAVTYEDPAHAELVATPDGLCVTTPDTVEAKMSGWFGGGSTLDAWGQPDTDEIPEGYLLQVNHGMRIIGRARAALAALDPLPHVAYGHPTMCHVAALLPHKKSGVTLYRVAYDPALAAMVEQRALEFMEYVKAKKPPPVDASENYTRHLARHYAKPSKDWIPSTAYADGFAADYIAAKAAEAEAKKKKRYAENALCEVIGLNYGVKAAGKWQAAWYPVRGDAVLDEGRIRSLLIERAGGREAMEAIVADCTDHTLNRGRLVERVRALAKSKAEADRLVEACCERSPGYRKFKLTETGKKTDDNNGGDDE